ncbi:MAG: Gx transporter family protein [Oscillospiraceae bacterium]|nr:Gx transporter family protein [Oscillospiraceae bacterium]
MPIKTNAQKAAFCAVFAAIAVALSWLESTIAPLLVLPPGVKPGLSNVAVMFCTSALGLPFGLIVAFLKSIFAGITRGTTAFAMSCGAGLISTCAVGICLRKRPKYLSLTGIGMLGGVLHNMTQLALAAFVTQTPAIALQLPLLILCGLASGAITGTLLRAVRRFFINK